MSKILRYFYLICLISSCNLFIIDIKIEIEVMKTFLSLFLNFSNYQEECKRKIDFMGDRGRFDASHKKLHRSYIT